MEWRGAPSSLSWRRLNWPVVSAAQRAARATDDAAAPLAPPAPAAPVSLEWQRNAPLSGKGAAVEVVRTRRSATAFNTGSMSMCGPCPLPCDAACVLL